MKFWKFTVINIVDTFDISNNRLLTHDDYNVVHK